MLLLTRSTSRAGRARSRAATSATAPRRRSATSGSPRSPSRSAPAEALLGVDDDVDFREALRTLRLAGVAQAESSDPRLALRRSEARSLIAAIAEDDADRRRRSRAMTLLGVISFASALSDSQDQDALQRDALARFRGAIALDPDNDEAKANLEIALRRDAEAGESGGGDDPTPGGQGARGAGAGEAGGGY